MLLPWTSQEQRQDSKEAAMTEEGEGGNAKKDLVRQRLSGAGPSDPLVFGDLEGT